MQKGKQYHKFKMHMREVLNEYPDHLFIQIPKSSNRCKTNDSTSYPITLFSVQFKDLKGVTTINYLIFCTITYPFAGNHSCQHTHLWSKEQFQSHYQNRHDSEHETLQDVIDNTTL